MTMWYGGSGPRGVKTAANFDLDRERGRYLSFAERRVIQAGINSGQKIAAIAAELGRPRSTVYRELARNRGNDGLYHAGLAHARASDRAPRPKPFKLADPGLCATIAEWMDDGWSPGLIAKVLRADAGLDRSQRVSHETIYQALYVQTRGSLRANLARSLSTGRTARKRRGVSGRRGKPYAGALTISQRPASVADRAVPGHWEGDLIVGPGGKSAIGTLVERSTRFTILLHLPGDHTAETVARAMVDQMGQLPAHLRRSLTWDRGTELAAYDKIQLALQMPVYFADPHSPWQRGSNENTNRLLRFWFTKGSDLSTWDPTGLRTVADKLNRRPRPTLEMKTPAQALNQLLTVATTT
nr:IS30 family transposase [Ruania rhizosphaerae]